MFCCFSEKILGRHHHVLCQSLAFLKQQVDIYTQFLYVGYTYYIHVYIYVHMYMLRYNYMLCLDITLCYICIYQSTIFPVFQPDLRHTTNHLNVYFASDFFLSAFITFQFFLKTLQLHSLRNLFTSEFPSYSFIDC